MFISIFTLQDDRCVAEACGAKVDRVSAFHDRCRAHAPCSVSVGERISWNPLGCSVCMSFLQRARKGDASAKGSAAAGALSILRFWVGGFAKNKKTSSLGYLPDTTTLKFLFPSARLTAVRGYEGATLDTPWPEGEETVLPPWTPLDSDEEAMLVEDESVSEDTSTGTQELTEEQEDELLGASSGSTTFHPRKPFEILRDHYTVSKPLPKDRSIDPAFSF